VLSALCSEFEAVYDADDGRIDRAILVTFRHTCRGAADYNDAFVVARTDGIHSDDVAALIGAVQIDRLYDEQLLAVEAFVFLRGNDGAEDASNYHVSSQHSAVGSQQLIADC